MPFSSNLVPGWPGQLACPGREATGGGCQDVRTSGEGLPVVASCNTRTKRKQFRSKTFALLDKPAVAPDEVGEQPRVPSAVGGTPGTKRSGVTGVVAEGTQGAVAGGDAPIAVCL